MFTSGGLVDDDMIITRQQFRDRLPVASFPHWQDEAFEKKGCVKDHQLEMLMLLVNVAKKTSLTCFVRIEALRILYIWPFAFSCQAFGIIR